MNKLDFILYVKTGKLSRILYFLAALLILIPIFIVIAADLRLSSNFAEVTIDLSFAMVITGKLLTIINKEKGDKSLPAHIGILSGIILSFLLHIYK